MAWACLPYAFTFSRTLPFSAILQSLQPGPHRIKLCSVHNVLVTVGQDAFNFPLGLLNSIRGRRMCGKSLGQEPWLALFLGLQFFETALLFLNFRRRSRGAGRRHGFQVAQFFAHPERADADFGRFGIDKLLAQPGQRCDRRIRS